MDGGQPGPGLRVVWFGQHRGVEVGQGRVELVAVLEQHRTLHAHRHRRRRLLPPGRERGLRVAHVARVTRGRGLVEVALRQLHGQPGITRVGTPGHAQRLQVARTRVGHAGGHGFEHLRVVGGQVRRRRDGQAQRGQQGQRGARPEAWRIAGSTSGAGLGKGLNSKGWAEGRLVQEFGQTLSTNRPGLR